MEARRIKYYVTKCFEELEARKEPIVILTGGAGSGKSFSVIQYLIKKLYTEKDKNFLITRKTGPALKQTAYKIFIEQLKELDLYRLCEHNKSDKVIHYRGNYVLFTSIDDPEKIKSTDFNYIWMEEADEFTYQDFLQLNLRKRSKIEKGELNQIILTHNPTDEFGYINQELVQNRGIVPILSTYLDNPFLPQEYIDEIEALADQNEDYWKIYGLGQYAQLSNVIFNQWMSLTEYPKNFDEVIYGVDFGFNSPTAVIKVGIKDNEIFPTELLYESGLTNAMLVKRIQELGIRPIDILYCDSEAPEKIEEIRQAGFFAKPAYKSRGSVKEGIDLMKTLKIWTHVDNINLNKERANYVWKTDKAGNISEEPLKHNDHALDALRYALYTHIGQNALPQIFVV